FFFFNHPVTTALYTLSLHDALPISSLAGVVVVVFLTVTALTAQQKNPLTNADVIKMVKAGLAETTIVAAIAANDTQFDLSSAGLDRKSTRLNSSHVAISYAVFCLKK